MCPKFCDKRAMADHDERPDGARKVARTLTAPEELRALVGKSELMAALPGDKKDRERRALAVLKGFHAILDDAREALAAPDPLDLRQGASGAWLERRDPAGRSACGVWRLARKVYPYRQFGRNRAICGQR